MTKRLKLVGWSKEHKGQVRNQILESAARLFMRRGFDNVSIDEVMQNAGLTRGAFYAHFKSKSELYAEAIRDAALKSIHAQEKAPPICERVENYLSVAHRKGEEMACPLAFLVSDVSQQNDTVRDVYTKVFKGFVTRLSESTQENISNQQALQSAVLMIGGMAIARALNDDSLAEQLLVACQQAIDL
ncbi:TetR/AcrR family transcriptional regulator [Zooshikella ganghwensis]|uniref:TetR/AcrR family transcriptional regulator n=1 Tax=Zooshikella ganghwensis TaxID=202772 RepID=A0A4P9VHE1_9GAMM|nr:TetR/AcrR family transcriptional regulator [Zooshikella ganghwensis]RDH42585.1 TetR/AcrR family transcriptional regulator [Zooshikella ganghwensis]